MTTRTPAAAALLTTGLLLLTACGNGDDEATEAPETQDTTAEATEGLTDEEVEELIAEENELFAEWFTVSAGSEEEAQIDARLDEIYEILEAEFGDEPPEGLALLSYMEGEEGGPVMGEENYDPILGDREFSGRMNGPVSGSIGEPLEFDQGVFEGLGDFVGTLTLEELVGAPQCEDEDYGELYPESEHFIFATFTIEVDDDAEQGVNLDGGDFRWLDYDDYISSFDTYVCEEGVNGLLDTIRPGETAERTMVFDVPEWEGTLSYRDATFDVDWDITREDYDNGENLP